MASHLANLMRRLSTLELLLCVRLLAAMLAQQIHLDKVAAFSTLLADLEILQSIVSFNALMTVIVMAVAWK